MSKELKALKRIKKMYVYFIKHYRELEPTLMICEKEDFDSVETALKDYQELKQINIDRSKQMLDLVSERTENTKKLKALEIIKETPEFAWYVKSYENAYEMITDVKGFRVYNSAEELQEMFELLKEVLGL